MAWIRPPACARARVVSRFEVVETYNPTVRESPVKRGLANLLNAPTLSIDGFRWTLGWLLKILILITKFQVVSSAQPDNRLRHGVDPVIVFTIGKLRALADDRLSPVAVHEPHAPLL